MTTRIILHIDSFSVLENVMLPKLDQAGKCTFQFLLAMINYVSIQIRITLCVGIYVVENGGKLKPCDRSMK